MNNNYRLYIESIYSLVETLSVKFEDVADATNIAVMTNYGYNSVTEDKHTWKYYQNISGSYHFSDKSIYISSLDVLDEDGNPEQIIFNKENLVTHPATRKAYQFGKRHYYSLIQRYPDQVMLIQGILYPCDIATAIDAKDGTILSYPSYLVEFNEYNFISKLQNWIYNYCMRWVNRQYIISDDLYLATYIAQFYINLVPCIINLRLQACKTNEAHSFHVRQYLASHGMLDIYLDIMTKEQALFFYRNILYIQRNSGTTDTFNWLVENLMTNRKLPLYEYTMKHDVSSMLISEDNLELNYQPNIIFEKEIINFQEIDKSVPTFTLDKIISKLNFITEGNELYQSINHDVILEELEDSKSNILHTKLLESTIVDYSDATPYPFSNILINQWLYQVGNGTYNAYLPLFIPKSKQIVNLSTHDAYVLFIYAMCKTVGITLIDMPNVMAYRVLKQPLPTVATLRTVASKRYVTDAEIVEAYATVPKIVENESIDSFYKQCKLIYNSTIEQYAIQCSKENFNTRGEISSVIKKLYADVRVNLNKDGLRYGEWLANNDLNLDDFTEKDFTILAASIVNEATGASANKTISIKQIQRAMIEILTLLSSYSIQIVSDITEPPVQLLPIAAVEAGDVDTTEKTHNYVNGSTISVIDIDTKEKDKFEIISENNRVLKILPSKEKDITRLNFGIGFKVKTIPASFDPTEVKLSNFRVLDIVDNLNTAQTWGGNNVSWGDSSATW